MGADKVTCCPLGDGYEFAFQATTPRCGSTLSRPWARPADYRREIPLFVEYKPSETRGRCFLDTATKALCLLNDIGIDEMGITLDFGHSKYGHENPAEVVSLLANARFPFYVHINDNNARWDWDYMVASHNFLEYVEFLYYLQEVGYEDYLTSDTSPTRWDIKGTFEANARVTNRIWDKLNALDRESFRTLIAERDYLAPPGASSRKRSWRCEDHPVTASAVLARFSVIPRQDSWANRRSARPDAGRDSSPRRRPDAL